MPENADRGIAPVIPLFGRPEPSVAEEGEPGPQHPARRARSNWALPEEDAGAPSAPSKPISSVSEAALARRSLSVSEVHDRLTGLGYAEADVLDELDRLQRLGYVDDARLAEEVVRVESERKGKGRGAITAELRRRGVSTADAGEALETLDVDDERDRATELAVHRIGQMRGLDDETARRRLYGFLARRGFRGSEVSAAVDAALTSRH